MPPPHPATPRPQTLSDRKRKMASLKAEQEGELEELKSSHELELATLRDKMRRDKNSASSAISDQVSPPSKYLQTHTRTSDTCV